LNAVNTKYVKSKNTFNKGT